MARGPNVALFKFWRAKKKVVKKGMGKKYELMALNKKSL